MSQLTTEKVIDTGLTNILETLPPEVILHILSYLDLPDLDSLSRISTSLGALTKDPLLHKCRILIVAPSRVKHSLFGHGGALRPTIPDLVHWGVLRGLGIERRWRMGTYFNSRESVKQYEISRRLQLSHVRHVLSTHLQSKSPTALARVPPDSEPCAPRLLPVIRRLKWCIRKDKLAQMVRDRDRDSGANIITVSKMGDDTRNQSGSSDIFGESSRRARVGIDWFEGRGYGLWKENERFRLAICPGVGKYVRYFESLGK